MSSAIPKKPHIQEHPSQPQKRKGDVSPPSGCPAPKRVLSEESSHLLQQQGMEDDTLATAHALQGTVTSTQQIDSGNPNARPGKSSVVVPEETTPVRLQDSQNLTRKSIQEAREAKNDPGTNEGNKLDEDPKTRDEADPTPDPKPRNEDLRDNADPKTIDPKPKDEANPKPDPKSMNEDPKLDPKPRDEADPEPNPVAKSGSKPRSEDFRPDPKSKSEDLNLKLKNEDSKPDPKLKSEDPKPNLKSEDEADPKPEPDAKPDPKPDAKPRDEATKHPLDMESSKSDVGSKNDDIAKDGRVQVSMNGILGM